MAPLMRLRAMLRVLQCTIPRSVMTDCQCNNRNNDPPQLRAVGERLQGAANVVVVQQQCLQWRTRCDAWQGAGQLIMREQERPAPTINRSNRTIQFAVQTVCSTYSEQRRHLTQVLAKRPPRPKLCPQFGSQITTNPCAARCTTQNVRHILTPRVFPVSLQR
jgi:hypothetical protein